jgi:hypothetical protein
MLLTTALSSIAQPLDLATWTSATRPSGDKTKRSVLTPSSS